MLLTPSSSDRAPDLMPVLSRGKHRNPKRGACFMEMASYLAGERWSDSPRCTHPLLAAIARSVNDGTSDRCRSRLAPHIPSVVGLTSEDPRLDVELALVCARHALPVSSAERQRALAVGIRNAERTLAVLDGAPVDRLHPASRAALAAAPEADRWALQFTRRAGRLSLRAFRRHAAPSIVSLAVRGIAHACTYDVDDRLYALLVESIDVAQQHVGARTTVDERRWREAVALTR